MPATKTQVRAKARERWGRDWHRVHGVMKRARLAWATLEVEGRAPDAERVSVTEADGSQYVV